MRRNLTTLAIIFSVVLNLAFVGSYLYHELAPRFLPPPRADRDRLIFEELNLSPDQLAKFLPLRDRFHAFLRQQGQAVKDRQLELIGLLAGKNPARSAVDAKQAEIRELQHEMQTRVIDHLFEESKILTPDQRRDFFALIRARIDKSSSTCPPWIPRSGSSHGAQ